MTRCNVKMMAPRLFIKRHPKSMLYEVLTSRIRYLINMVLVLRPLLNMVYIYPQVSTLSPKNQTISST